MARVVRARGTGTYTKPALTLDQLVDRLADRGLDIADRGRAVRYLRHIGYYRLSPYTIPFQEPGTDHTFRAGAGFDDVLDLYVFDRALRLLVLDAVERVEVAIRSALTDHMSLSHSDPHWYVDPRHFRDTNQHRRFVEDIRKECGAQLSRHAETQGDGLNFRSALEHYLTTYRSPELPPSWLMVEMLTIGQLDHLIRNLAKRSDRTAIARTLGVNERLLGSWLRTYVRVRNICAHHGRLWNVGLGVYPALPAASNVSWLEDPSVLDGPRSKRLYPVLVSLQAILDTISPHSSWASRVSELMEAHPNLPLRGLGIPDDWRDDGFWARQLVADGTATDA